MIDIIIYLIFLLSGANIFFAMIGYPLFLRFLDILLKPKDLEKDYSRIPEVTLLIVAHNEEKIIQNKLENYKKLSYPKDKIRVIVTSDHSTDKTNEIVKNFIINNPEHNIKLYEVKERKGKTNAQNEAVKIIETPFIVFTDANSILHQNSIKELMSSFVSENIAYVTGRLLLINSTETSTSMLESTYWDFDTKTRSIESKFQTITAGNGALYSCRKNDYIDVSLIKSHDTAFPIYFNLNKKKAIANDEALAFEKAGKSIRDEFLRKVRMNRVLLINILPSLKILNVFRYKWFTFFYLGHRTSRYMLWFSHLTLFISTVYLINYNFIFLIALSIQSLFVFLTFCKLFFKIDNKVINFISYYSITVYAQWVAICKTVFKKTKPTWEKVESIRD